MHPYGFLLEVDIVDQSASLFPHGQHATYRLLAMEMLSNVGLYHRSRVFYPFRVCYI
jgi:hypothetical protein